MRYLPATTRWWPEARQHWMALLSAATVLGTAAFVLVAARLDLLLLATGAAFLPLALLVSLRWPLLPLFAFAALIPVDDLISFSSLGTMSRIAGVLFLIAYGVPRMGRIRVRAMPFAGWAYIGWAVLSIGWALDRSQTLAELSTLVQLFIVAVLIADVVANQPWTVRALMWTYSLTGGVTALVGIASYVSGGEFAGERVAALPNQDPAQFAALLVPAFIFALYELVNGRLLLLSAALSLLDLAAILLSGTRGAWLSVAVVVTIFVLPQLRPSRRFAAVGMIGVMLVLALQLPGVANLVTQRAAAAIPSGGAGRTDIWTVGLVIFESSPVAGVGFANFPEAYTHQAIQQSGITLATGTGRGPHNIVIGTLGELGLVGLVLLGTFIVPLVVRRGWGPDGAVVRAMLAALMIDAFFLDILSNRKQVWLVIGLAAGLAFLARQRAAAETATVSGGSTADRSSLPTRSQVRASQLAGPREHGGQP